MASRSGKIRLWLPSGATLRISRPPAGAALEWLGRLRAVMECTGWDHTAPMRGMLEWIGANRPALEDLCATYIVDDAERAQWRAAMLAATAPDVAKALQVFSDFAVKAARSTLTQVEVFAWEIRGVHRFSEDTAGAGARAGAYGPPAHDPFMA